MPTGKASRDLQVFDPVLTEVARQFKPGGFVYDQLAPRIPVNTVSGQYPVFDERYFFADDIETKVSDRAETPEIELVWSTETYLCEDYALMATITPRERKQAANPATGDALRLEASKMSQVQTRMALRRERRLAAALLKTTNGGKLNLGAAAGTAWATSTAIESDIKTAKLAVYNATGQSANTLVLPYAKAYDVATNATIRDIFKYLTNGDAFISLDGPGGERLLPSVIHGLRVIVPKGTLYHSGNVKATKSLSDIWGTSARVLYVAENGDWGIPSVAYSFWHEPLTVDGDGEKAPVVDTWSEKNPVKDCYRVTECVSEKVTGADLGYEISGI